MIGKGLVVVLAIFLLIGVFSSPILDGIKSWRTNDTSENALVTTAAAQTTANVTLSYDLYQASTGEVQGITSTDGTDTPVASSYTEATKVLLVSGLNDDATRTLTIEYYAETDDDVMRVLGPFLGFLIFGGCVGALIYGWWHKR